jgi:hypothetical protein
MKKTFGLMALMLTAVAAFAQPAAARDRDRRDDYARKTVVVVRHDDRRIADRNVDRDFHRDFRRDVRYVPAPRCDYR